MGALCSTGGSKEFFITRQLLETESGRLQVQVEDPEVTFRLRGKASWDPLVMSARAWHRKVLGIGQP